MYVVGGVGLIWRFEKCFNRKLRDNTMLAEVGSRGIGGGEAVNIKSLEMDSGDDLMWMWRRLQPAIEAYEQSRWMFASLVCHLALNSR